MNLERHVRLLWRYRGIVGGGLILGMILAILAAYQVSSDGVKRRGNETWSSNSTILVTQKGFPWGRVTLPATEVPGQTTPAPDEGDDRIKFADPTRFASLAVLYSVISHSDQVRARLPEKPKADQIQAVPLDPTNSGNAFQPIISLTTTATTGKTAFSLNKHAYEGLRDLLLSEQEQNEIPPRDRVELTLLNQASAPILVAGRSLTSSILAFLLCAISAVALAHILEALQLARVRREEAHRFDTLLFEGAESNGHGNGMAFADPDEATPRGESDVAASGDEDAEPAVAAGSAQSSRSRPRRSRRSSASS